MVFIVLNSSLPKEKRFNLQFKCEKGFMFAEYKRSNTINLLYLPQRS